MLFFLIGSFDQNLKIHKKIGSTPSANTFRRGRLVVE
jgi:hypothetical protein